MKKNVGLIDKIVRISMSVLIAVLYFTDQISGTLALVLGVFSITFLVTSFSSFCPLYLPFGISTRKRKLNGMK